LLKDYFSSDVFDGIDVNVSEVKGCGNNLTPL
jgi:hypothetical protein